MPSDGCICKTCEMNIMFFVTSTKWKNKTGRIFNLKLISLIGIRKLSANAPALFPRSANYPAGGPIFRREFTQDKHAPGRKTHQSISECVCVVPWAGCFFSFLAIRFQAKIDILHFSSLKIYYDPLSSDLSNLDL